MLLYDSSKGRDAISKGSDPCFKAPRVGRKARAILQSMHKTSVTTGASPLRTTPREVKETIRRNAWCSVKRHKGNCVKSFAGPRCSRAPQGMASELETAKILGDPRQHSVPNLCKLKQTVRETTSEQPFLHVVSWGGALSAHDPFRRAPSTACNQKSAL